MRTIAIAPPLSMARIGSASPVDKREIERAGGELLHERGARLDEHHVELEILGRVVALVEPDIDRPVGRRYGADQADGHGVGRFCDGRGEKR